MGKFDHKMPNTGKPLDVIFFKCHTKVAILVESVIAKKSDVILSVSFIILSNKEIKIAKQKVS